MVAKNKTPITKPLTEVELELMNLVWQLGECTVKDVQMALPAERALAYTSVATILKILEQKSVLQSRKGEKAHTYVPMLSREQYEALSLKHLSDHVFQGQPSSMVMRLLGENRLSRAELEAIRKLLNERLAK